MAEVGLSGPRRLSDFVGLLHQAPSLAELDRLRGEGIRAVLDTRQTGDELTPPESDALAAALIARDMAYARLGLPRDEPDTVLLDRFGEVMNSLPKPLVIVSAVGDPGGLFAMAHIAIEQGMTGQAMLDAARSLGMDDGSAEMREQVAAYVDGRLGRAAPPHQGAVVMHAEMTAVAQPLRSPMNDLSMQIAAGFSIVGLLGALLVDRRLAALSLIGVGYMAQRAWPLISRPIAVAKDETVPQSEVDGLRRKLDNLKTA